MPAYFSVIFVRGKNQEFGYKGSLPWEKLKEDLRYFQKITTETEGNGSKKNIVIMGRLTFESMGHKPLSNRINIVISRRIKEGTVEGILVAKDFQNALEQSALLIKEKHASKVFLIGGASLIQEALIHPGLEYVYRTTVTPLNTPSFSSDVTAPIIASENFKIVRSWNEASSDGRYEMLFEKLVKASNHPEKEYLKLCEYVMEKGLRKIDRTGTGTMSISGGHLRVPLDKYPLYTTKNVFFRGVAEELLFFLSGKTDTKILEAKGVNVWKGNTSRAALDKLGFTDYKEGEMGPCYGFQWRHYGGEYKPNIQLELGQSGFDQIAWVIESIKKVKNDPSCSVGRRLLIVAWNPLDMPKCALPCCHYSLQFIVESGFLNCIVTMRSNDLGCGNPFNVASYALLTYMICHLVGLKPGELVLNMGDCHIYLNHIEGLREQVQRPPRSWPQLQITRHHDSIDDFNLDSFLLIDYEPHPTIKLEMAV